MTEIRISLQQTGSSGLLIVENNGVGIPAADKEKIFERGYGKGTGWGLFLAREILAVTGMTITETGEPGKGVRFEITLPPGSFRMDGEESPGPVRPLFRHSSGKQVLFRSFFRLGRDNSRRNLATGGILFTGYLPHL